MSKNTFRVKYEIADDYTGASKPQYFTIDADWLPDDFDEEDLKTFLEESVQEHFTSNITTYTSPSYVDQFVDWGKRIIAEREEE